MKKITIITGPMRSGTSCLTGLLEMVGFDLGKNIRVMRDKTEHNPRGHFEAALMHTINTRLVEEVPGGDWSLLHIPNERDMEELAGSREHYFSLFVDKFDGALCKDPLLCLTIPFWERRWPGLQKAIYCLRNPLSVARSMQKRYAISYDDGLRLWHTYTSRFFGSRLNCGVYVFDFDEFSRNPNPPIEALLSWLGKSVDRSTVTASINAFYSPTHVHWSCDDAELSKIPADISTLYQKIRSATGPYRR